MKGCNKCPALAKCTAVYRGPECAAMRASYGVDGDPEIITNADKIRAMTDEELADLLRGLCKNAMDCDECPMHESCPEGSYDLIPWMEWLQSTVESPDRQEREENA